MTTRPPTSHELLKKAKALVKVGRLEESFAVARSIRRTSHRRAEALLVLTRALAARQRYGEALETDQARSLQRPRPSRHHQAARQSEAV